MPEDHSTETEYVTIPATTLAQLLDTLHEDWLLWRTDDDKREDNERRQAAWALIEQQAPRLHQARLEEQADFDDRAAAELATEAEIYWPDPKHCADADDWNARSGPGTVLPAVQCSSDSAI